VLLEGGDGGLVPVDAGFPDRQADSFKAVKSIGGRPEDERTWATTRMHAVDVPISEQGGRFGR
jgi:hypothetical protein